MGLVVYGWGSAHTVIRLLPVKPDFEISQPEATTPQWPTLAGLDQLPFLYGKGLDASPWKTPLPRCRAAPAQVVCVLTTSL